jgi:hypothetical protein
MTLYLSDLDGTLLNSNQELTPYTIETVNQFINNGGLFSYATARSLVTASQVAGGLLITLPTVCYNGAFIFGNQGEIKLSHFFTPSKMAYIRQTLTKHSVSPIIYAFVNGKERFSYIREPDNTGKVFHLTTRPGDARHREVFTDEELYQGGEAFYYTCIGDEKSLAPIREIFKADGEVQCIYHRDLYYDAMWCEILPAKASKAHAALALKGMLGCDRLVVFGDGFNDLSMFQAADECYATANAVPELKEIATAVIASNDEDGVAGFLYDRALI